MRLLKNGQMRGARRPMSEGVLWSYVEAKSAERNEAVDVFQQPKRSEPWISTLAPIHRT